MRLSKNSKIAVLQRAPLFADCSKRELGAIAAIADEIDIRPGTAFIREGERGREFFAIVDGTVAVSKSGRGIEVRGGTDAFGEISLLNDAPRNATVTATSPVRAIVVTDRAFTELLRSSPALQLKLLSSLAARLAGNTPV